MHAHEKSQPTYLFNGHADAKKTVALAHGAGAGMDTPFMNAFAEGLAADGWRVARFEFPYMAERRPAGTKRPPDREPVLRETWLQLISELGRKGLVIGGKSMGGRIASLVADEAKVSGLSGLPLPPNRQARQAACRAVANHSDADLDSPGHARCVRDSG